MVSSTGHDGPMGASGVKRLSKLGMITGAPGMGALDMNSAEDAVVRSVVTCQARSLVMHARQSLAPAIMSWFHDMLTSFVMCPEASNACLPYRNVQVAHTREVVPGMVICGMEVAELDGAPRMGPTFGAMFISGQKAAHCALNSLKRCGVALNRLHGCSLPAFILRVCQLTVRQSKQAPIVAYRRSSSAALSSIVLLTIQTHGVHTRPVMP